MTVGPPDTVITVITAPKTAPKTAPMTKLKYTCEPAAPARLVGNTIVNKDYGYVGKDGKQHSRDPWIEGPATRRPRAAAQARAQGGGPRAGRAGRMPGAEALDHRTVPGRRQRGQRELILGSVQALRPMGAAAEHA